MAHRDTDNESEEHGLDASGEFSSPLISDAPSNQITEVDIGRLPKSADKLERVEADDIGISAQVLGRALHLSNFALKAYPGGKDLGDIWSHFKNRGKYAQNTLDSYQNDCARMERSLKMINGDDPTPDNAYKAEIFRADKLQGVVYHNDHEIIISFEGSDAFDTTHWDRNLPQSMISNQAHCFFNEEYLQAVKTKDFTKYEEAIDRLATRCSESDDEKARVKNYLLNARVHGGWWNSLNMPVLKGTERGSETDDHRIWPSMQTYVETLQANMAKDGKHPKIVFSGHSSGGALCMIAAARWMETHEPVNEIYTYNQPRVGNMNFRNSLYELMGNGIAPIYRFEMMGDYVPCLPPMNSEHWVHAGNWICLVPNGNLFAVRHEGKIVTAAEASQSVTVPMTSGDYLYPAIEDEYHRELASNGLIDQHVVHPEEMVMASERQIEELRKGYGFDIDKASKIKTAASFFRGIREIPQHINGHTGYRHVLPTMREALSRQLRMEKLRMEQGECLSTDAMCTLLDNLTTTLDSALEHDILDDVPGITRILSKVHQDKMLFEAAVEHGLTCGISEPCDNTKLHRAGSYLANARSDNPKTKLDQLEQPGSLVQLMSALDGHQELEKLHGNVCKVIHQLEYFLATHATVELDKSGIKHTKTVTEQADKTHNER